MANKPVKTFRIGQITISLWRNPSEKYGDTLSVTIRKQYKSGEEWKETKSFNVNDLPKLQTGLQKAYEYIVLSESKDNNDEPDF